MREAASQLCPHDNPFLCTAYRVWEHASHAELARSADRLAQIDGTVADNKLSVLVPPAGWLSPAVSVKRMLAFALVEAGRAEECGQGRPAAACA
jgi:hypothetical protein